LLCDEDIVQICKKVWGTMLRFLSHDTWTILYNEQELYLLQSSNLFDSSVNLLGVLLLEIPVSFRGQADRCYRGQSSVLPSRSRLMKSHGLRLERGDIINTGQDSIVQIE
jgi:hypothetical protein